MSGSSVPSLACTLITEPKIYYTDAIYLYSKLSTTCLVVVVSYQKIPLLFPKIHHEIAFDHHAIGDLKKRKGQKLDDRTYTMSLKDNDRHRPILVYLY